MKQWYRPALLAVLLVLFAFLFGGCSAPPVTQMTIQEGFSGQRVMTCTPSADTLDKIPGGEAALDALLLGACPPSLTWKKTGQGSDAVYSFALPFSNERDYRDKVEALLGREASLLYAAPDSIFANGLRLEEDFSSGDLMAWLDQALVEQQLCTEKPGLFSQGGSQVTVGGQTFLTGDRLEIREFTYLPVNKVTVSTKLLPDERFSRTISISIPQRTCDQLGDALEPYLRQRIPAGGSSFWNTDAAGRTFSISFDALDNASLAAQTAQALDSDSSESVLEPQEDPLFHQQVLFTERLNFSSFPSNQYGNTFVEYRFSAGHTFGVSKPQLFVSGRWMDVPSYLDSEGFLFQEDSALMQVRLQSHSEFSVESVAVTMRRLTEGTFEREILLNFSPESGRKGAETASAYFGGLGIDGLTASAEGTRCVLSLQGAGSELSDALTSLFGPGNGVSLGKRDGFELFHSSLVYDKIDMKSFLQRIEYGGTVSYTYIGDGPLSSLDQEEPQSAQAVRADSSTVTCSLPPGGTATLTAQARWTNPWYVLMLCGAALLFLSAAGSIGMLVWRHSVRRREAKRSCPPEEFPVTARRCASCEARLYLGMPFCTKCGYPVSLKPDETDD